jgi:hypothetical protein
MDLKLKFDDWFSGKKGESEMGVKRCIGEQYASTIYSV